MTGVIAMLRVQGSSLVSTDEVSEDTIRGLPEGRIVECQIIRRRSAEKLRAYWAICGRIAKLLQAMGREDMTKDAVDEVIRIGTGYAHLTPLSARMRAQTGQRYGVRATSIALHKMKDPDFDRFFNRALAFVAVELLPHMPTRELREELERIVYGDRA